MPAADWLTHPVLAKPRQQKWRPIRGGPPAATHHFCQVSEAISWAGPGSRRVMGSSAQAPSNCRGTCRLHRSLVERMCVAVVPGWYQPPGTTMRRVTRAMNTTGFAMQSSTEGPKYSFGACFPLDCSNNAAGKTATGSQESTGSLARPLPVEHFAAPRKDAVARKQIRWIFDGLFRLPCSHCVLLQRIFCDAAPIGDRRGYFSHSNFSGTVGQPRIFLPHLQAVSPFTAGGKFPRTKLDGSQRKRPRAQRKGEGRSRQGNCSRLWELRGP